MCTLSRGCYWLHVFVFCPNRPDFSFVLQSSFPIPSILVTHRMIHQKKNKFVPLCNISPCSACGEQSTETESVASFTRALASRKASLRPAIFAAFPAAFHAAGSPNSKTNQKRIQTGKYPGPWVQPNLVCFGRVENANYCNIFHRARARSLDKSCVEWNKWNYESTILKLPKLVINPFWVEQSKSIIHSPIQSFHCERLGTSATLPQTITKSIDSFSFSFVLYFARFHQRWWWWLLLLYITNQSMSTSARTRTTTTIEQTIQTNRQAVRDWWLTSKLD